ncbi:MAG: stalk domain-containing protein, partial [Candidatus Cryosericum sp.]
NNNPTKAYMEAQSSNIHVLLGSPSSGNGSSFPIHNKMVLARIGGAGYVDIASINGSENASRANRELGLIVQSNAGFEYFYKMFAADWAVSGGASLSNNPGTVYSIYSAGTTGGTITPSGALQVMNGESQTFAMKPDFGYFISKVLVDGVPIKVVDQVGMSPTMTYTFDNVTSNHTISAEFVRLPDTTPPTLTLPTIGGIDLDAPGSTITINSDTFTFTVVATDDTGIGRLLVKVNGQSQIDKSDLDPTIFLSEGTNSVEVIVYDRAGNYASKSFSIISDTKPPVVTLTDVPKTVTKDALVLRGTVFDQTTGLRSFTINGNQIITTLTGEFETTVTLNQGANAITVDALDRVGNRFTQTYTISYTQPQVRQSYMLVLTVGSPIITVNGLSKKIDAQGSTPVIKNSRTLLPIRTLIESLGGTVSWNSSEQEVIVNLHGHSMALWIGKTTALVDGSKVSLDVAPMILGGRTYLPLRFISEHLGASVDWNADSRTITIYYWE